MKLENETEAGGLRYMEWDCMYHSAKSYAKCFICSMVTT
jgi:hypothetical protein